MRPVIRARFSVLLALSMLFLIGLMSFEPLLDTYVGMQIQSVGGKPYLLLAENETFGIFAPSGSDLDSWTPVFENRSGEMLGSFEIPSTPVASPPVGPVESPKISAPPKTDDNGKTAPVAAKSPDEPIVGLGVFFRQNCAVFDIAKKGTDHDVVSMPMSLDWNPEASATLKKGDTFAFGAKLDPVATQGVFPNGSLKAARFDGKTWTELPGLTGPLVRSGKAGFWLKAVALDDRIAVLWRGAKLDQSIGIGVEGRHIATDGDIGMCFFDGMKFSAEATIITGLPKGNTSIWTDKGMIKCLVQTRVKSGEVPDQRGRMEIWNITPEGKATLAETILSTPHTNGLFANIAAEHFVADNREYILRSNWQKFELWKRNAAGSWDVSTAGTTGLPIFTLEYKLFGALAFCGLVVLLGVMLGFRRRRHALTILRNLQPSDLNAPIAPRIGAYFVDMFIVVAAAIAISQKFSDQYGDISTASLSNVGFPSTILLCCFMIYFTLSEWLLSATPGKFVMGLRVVSDDGLRPTFWASLVRNAVGLLERQPIMLIVSFPMVVFSPRRQRLGDLLSRTIVVQKQGLDLFMSQRAAAALRGESLEKLPGDPLEDSKKNERAK